MSRKLLVSIETTAGRTEARIDWTSPDLDGPGFAREVLANDRLWRSVREQGGNAAAGERSDNRGDERNAEPTGKGPRWSPRDLRHGLLGLRPVRPRPGGRVGLYRSVGRVAHSPAARSPPVRGPAGDSPGTRSRSNHFANLTSPPPTARALGPEVGKKTPVAEAVGHFPREASPPCQGLPLRCPSRPPDRLPVRARLEPG